MKIDNRFIKADTGKWLRRKSDGFIVGPELSLGYTYYIAGKKLDEPILEIPQDYEEIVIPEELVGE